mmetsp:Transcript_2064/g.6689  ORF Transcript_2064/g.6689 Transcript_2064/m.6689 type:complete len:80 (-) Transcript_2064:931-1170(-)
MEKASSPAVAAANGTFPSPDPNPSPLPCALDGRGVLEGNLAGKYANRALDPLASSKFPVSPAVGPSAFPRTANSVLVLK